MTKFTDKILKILAVVFGFFTCVTIFCAFQLYTSTGHYFTATTHNNLQLFLRACFVSVFIVFVWFSRNILERQTPITLYSMHISPLFRQTKSIQKSLIGIKNMVFFYTNIINQLNSIIKLSYSFTIMSVTANRKGCILFHRSF